MSFKLLLISSMYKNYLSSFYRKYPEMIRSDYKENYRALLNDSTEFVSSYVNNFNRLGLNSACVIANDPILQSKWKKERKINKVSGQEVLFDQIKFHKPDVLWIDDFHKVDADLLSKVRIELPSVRLIVGYHCSPYNLKVVDKMKYTDFIITCTPGMKIEFEKLGLKCYHVYHAFDTLLIPKIENKDNIADNHVVFYGTLLHGRGSHNERIKQIEKLLSADISLSIYLNLESFSKIKAKQLVYRMNNLLSLLRLDDLRKLFPRLEYLNTPVKNYSKLITSNNHGALFGIEMYRLLYSSAVGLNIHGEITGNYCGNMRMFETTGAGSCLLTENMLNLKDLFEPGVEVVAYENLDDCIEKARWLINNENERKRIAKAGHLRTLKDHTVENRCMQIRDFISLELQKKLTLYK